MRCPDCGTVVWYGDEEGVIRCATGHLRPGAPVAKTKVRSVSTASTKAVETDESDPVVSAIPAEK